MDIMVKPFKRATWNANGLAKHSQKIKTFIIRQNIDIFLFSEISKYFTRVMTIFLYHTMHFDGETHGETVLNHKKGY